MARGPGPFGIARTLPVPVVPEKLPRCRVEANGGSTLAGCRPGRVIPIRIAAMAPGRVAEASAGELLSKRRPGSVEQTSGVGRPKCERVRSDATPCCARRLLAVPRRFGIFKAAAPMVFWTGSRSLPFGRGEGNVLPDAGRNDPAPALAQTIQYAVIGRSGTIASRCASPEQGPAEALA